MGAYSHSRLRQLILGGVTRHVLENSNLPVMMTPLGVGVAASAMDDDAIA